MLLRISNKVSQQSFTFWPDGRRFFLRIHPTLDEAELPDLLDRILDKGVWLDSSALLFLYQADFCRQSDRLRVQSVETNVASYAQPAQQLPYSRFHR